MKRARCPKRRYRDEIAAKVALARVRSERSQARDKTPTRAYRCPACQGWHLTSMPLNQKGVESFS